MELDVANLWLGIVVAGSALIGTPLGGALASWLAPRIRGAYFWVSGLSMLAAVPFIGVALLDVARPLIFACIVLGLMLAVFNFGPSNTIIVNVTTPGIRAAAFAANTFLIHLLGDIPSPKLIGMVTDWTQSYVWGLGITLPALMASAIFFCLGARHLEADQEAMLQRLREGAV